MARTGERLEQKCGSASLAAADTSMLQALKSLDPTVSMAGQGLLATILLVFA
jgi:hypothetical protein